MADAAKSGISAVIHVDGAAVGGLTDVSLSVNGAQIDVTNKSDSQWEQYLGGRSSWTMSGENMVLLDSTDGTVEANFKALWLAISQSNSVVAKFILPTGSGNSFLTGTAYVTEWNLSGPDNEAFTGSFGLRGTSTLTLTTAT